MADPEVQLAARRLVMLSALVVLLIIDVPPFASAAGHRFGGSWCSDRHTQQVNACVPAAHSPLLLLL